MTNKNLLPTNLIQNSKIEECIYNIRGYQVMLDSDIAYFFGVETKRLNEQMNRNINRFPGDFCFQLSSEEIKDLRCQNGTTTKLSSKRRSNPYAYTEHGIIALAGVLKSEIANKMSVEIVRAFIQMRKFILNNNDILLSLARLQNRQLDFETETSKKLDEIFKIIDRNEFPKETLLCAGQFYDCYEYVSKLISNADENIILVDPYCDGKVFTYLKNIKPNVNVTICKSGKTIIPEDDRRLFELQYGTVEVVQREDIHDRFLIIDKKECYSLGASLNYMGKKLFSIIRFEDKKIIKTLVELSLEFIF